MLISILGPGAYRNFNYNCVSPKSPEISLSGRFEEKTPKQNLPGPGFYNPRHQSTKPSIPAFSLSGRHKEINFGETVPGPGSYDIKVLFFFLFSLLIHIFTILFLFS